MTISRPICLTISLPDKIMGFLLFVCAAALAGGAPLVYSTRSFSTAASSGVTNAVWYTW